MARGKRSKKRARKTRRPTQTQGPVSARPSSRRRRSLIYGLVLVSVVILAVSGILWWRFSVGEAERGAAPPAETPVSTIPEISDLEGVDPLVANAIAQAVATVRRSPTSGEAYGELGRLYHAHEYDDLARRCYAIAHRLAPRAADWPYYLGVLAEEAGDPEEAVKDFRAVLDVRPGDRAATLRLGNALLAAARLDEAEVVFRSLVAAAPAEPWGHVGLGKLERRRGRLEEAAEHLEEAVGLDPEGREASYLLAMTYGELGRAAEAERLLRQLPPAEGSSWPDDPLMAKVTRGRRDLQAMIRQGNQLLARGAIDAAEAVYRTVLAADPEHFDAHFDLGVLLQRRGDRAQATEEIRKAIEARPTSAMAHYALAVLLGEQGHIAEARAEAETALRLEPGHQGVRTLLDALR